MNKVIRQMSLDYNINSKALKRLVKDAGLKPKQATRLQILKIVYINAPDLFYCRADEYRESVEYLDINLNIKLCYELRTLIKETDFLG